MLGQAETVHCPPLTRTRTTAPELRKIAHFYYMMRVHELYAGMEACQDQFRCVTALPFSTQPTAPLCSGPDPPSPIAPESDEQDHLFRDCRTQRGETRLAPDAPGASGAAFARQGPPGAVAASRRTAFVRRPTGDTREGAKPDDGAQGRGARRRDAGRARGGGPGGGLNRNSRTREAPAVVQQRGPRRIGPRTRSKGQRFFAFMLAR